jgi:hypothetical protein
MSTSCCGRNSWPRENLYKLPIETQHGVKGFLKDNIPSLPSGWETDTSLFISTQNASPTGIWADFQCLHILYRAVFKAIYLGMASPGILPLEPQFNDYPNFSASKTIIPPYDCTLFAPVPNSQCVYSSEILWVT